MNEIEFQFKSVKLIEIIEKNILNGDSNTTYVAHVLQSFYEQGRRDEAHRLSEKEKAP